MTTVCQEGWTYFSCLYYWGIRVSLLRGAKQIFVVHT